MASGTTPGLFPGATSAIATVCAARARGDRQVPVTSIPRARHAHGAVVKSPSEPCSPETGPLTCGFVVGDPLGGRYRVVLLDRRKGKCAHDVRGRRDCRLPPSRGCTD